MIVVVRWWGKVYFGRFHIDKGDELKSNFLLHKGCVSNLIEVLNLMEIKMCGKIN